MTLSLSFGIYLKPLSEQLTITFPTFCVHVQISEKTQEETIPKVTIQLNKVIMLSSKGLIFV